MLKFMFEGYALNVLRATDRYIEASNQYRKSLLAKEFAKLRDTAQRFDEVEGGEAFSEAVVGLAESLSARLVDASAPIPKVIKDGGA